MKFFLAGIMQGSHANDSLHSQSYRDDLRLMLAAAFPGAEIYDPFSDHGDSIGYDDATARDVFYRHNRMCREVDCLIAFAPEASMGTAIEMWEAHEHGSALVVAISPLKKNWAVKFSSHVIYEDMAAFENDVASGKLKELIAERKTE